MTKARRQNNKYCILLATDFVAPKFGGVETHSYKLAQCLIELGHKVIMVSSMQNYCREGVRVMANGLKIYHLPLLPIWRGDVGFFAPLNIISVLRQIFIREHVDICHGHLSTSITMAMVLVAAKSYGIKTVFTEHAHFNYKDLGMIHVNKICKWYLKDVDAAICVSHACKENFTLRAKINPHKCFTIPNAVDTIKFSPNPSLRYPLNTINIVCMSRMSANKGLDFLIDIIPEVLSVHPNAYFILGGDGEKKALLEELIRKKGLQNNVELLGGLPHDKVP